MKTRQQVVPRPHPLFHVPGFAPHAPKRNVLVTLTYVVFTLLALNLLL